MKAPDLFGWLIIIGAFVMVAREIMERRRNKHGHGHQKPNKKHVCMGMTAEIRPKKRRFVMDLKMDWTDAAVPGIAPTDDGGRPAPVQTVTWESSNTAVKIEPSTDGKKAYAVPDDNFLTQPDPTVPDEPVVVTAHVDVDLGEGVEGFSCVALGLPTDRLSWLGLLSIS